MKKRKNILVFQSADCQSTCALNVASMLAQQTPDAKIHVVDVQPKLAAFWDELLDKKFHKEQKELRASQLKEFAEPFENGSEIISKVLAGRPVSRMVKYILENDIDLVVKVGGGETQKSILSSLDQRMVRQCPINLAVVSESQSFSRTDDGDRSRNVIVAINPIEDDAERKMNIRLLQSGAFLAQTFGATLNVVSAVKPPGIQWAHNDEAMEACLQVKSEALSLGMKCLQLALDASQISMNNTNLVLEFLEPESLILEQVNRLQPDFLVMGSVVRGWVRGLLVGSVTDRVSQELTCSLIALRPEEAISTVATRLEG